VELFKIWHVGDLLSWSNSMYVETGSQTKCESSLVIPIGLWTKVLISFYTRPYASNPIKTYINFAIYYQWPGTDVQMDLAVTCPFSTQIFNDNDGYFVIGGTGSTYQNV
jgi:hypothetical protein